ncbi:MAG: MBL fold metallo-hydrolase, partial [Chitinophagaceae bacterium]
HTPGHTLESSCFLLRDEQKKEHALFTGDTIFVGDVGRPDLSSGQMSSEELAGILYDSIQNKILPLADDVIIYPAHGPGSSCGKNIGPNTSSTLGSERASNYALQPQTKEAFVAAVTTGLGNAPRYFAINAQINQHGYTAIDEVIAKGMMALTVEEFKNKMKEDVVLLDTRHATEFTAGFIPGAIFIGLEGRFAEWAGSLLPFDKPILLVTPVGMEKEAITRLTRVGFEIMAGHLAGGFDSWKNAGEKMDMVINVEADELIMDMPHDPNLTVVDVRRETEYADGHLPDALNLPLSEMTDIAELAQFEDNQNLYVHCAGGYRSVIAASLLKRQGVHNLRNVEGGWAKIKEQEKVRIVREPSVLN